MLAVKPDFALHCLAQTFLVKVRVNYSKCGTCHQKMQQWLIWFKKDYTSPRQIELKYIQSNDFCAWGIALTSTSLSSSIYFALPKCQLISYFLLSLSSTWAMYPTWATHLFNYNFLVSTSQIKTCSAKLYFKTSNTVSKFQKNTTAHFDLQLCVDLTEWWKAFISR